MAKKVRLGSLSLSWHERNQQWRKSIGYKPDREGMRRVPAEFYFGADEAGAFLKAKARLEEWEALVANWERLRDLAVVLCPRMALDAPFWLPEDETEAEAEKKFAKHEAVVSTSLTVQAVKEKFIAGLRGRLALMGRKGMKQSTFNTIVANLGRAMAAMDAAGRLIIPDQKIIDSIGYDDIAAVVNFHYRKGGLSERSAMNYCRTFQMFLEWMDNQPGMQFQKPKGMDGLFRLGAPASDPRVPTMAEVKSILKACKDDQERLYVLLGINCGMYESDISSLTPAALVTHKKERYLWWRREKTSHQNSFHTMHWLFPETVKLLDAVTAPVGNPHGRLILHNGKPILEVKEAYRKKFISEAFERIIERAGMKGKGVSFKNLRKFGAHELRAQTKNDKDDLARKFLGQAIPGVLKDYVRDDFDDLTAELKRFRKRLVNQGLLADES